jgi:phosphate starvation-inducible PhoH-like protein
MPKKNLQLVANGEKVVSNTLKMRLEDMITIDAKTENQGQFMSQYRHKQAFLLHGCAGTGKTFIAMYRALEEVLDKGSPYDKVIVVRSAVPSREIGHLPGDQNEKTEVYSLPYQAMCQEFFPGKQQAYQRLVEQKYIEFMSTSFVRGITLDHSIIIVDECQNLNDMEINSIMTRVGVNTKIIFCGDFRQTDLYKRHDMSGLKKFMVTAENMPSFCTVEFSSEDIVRSDLVREYIEARMKYEDENPLSY